MLCGNGNYNWVIILIIIILLGGFGNTGCGGCVGYGNNNGCGCN